MKNHLFHEKPVKFSPLMLYRNLNFRICFHYHLVNKYQIKIRKLGSIDTIHQLEFMKGNI